MITKSRPSTGKRLIPEIIAFPFCVTSPNIVAPPLLLEALQTAGAFCFPLPLQKGQAELGCHRPYNCLKLPCANLKLGQCLRIAKDLGYLQGCHNPESEWYRAKKGVPLICNFQARAIAFQRPIGYLASLSFGT